MKLTWVSTVKFGGRLSFFLFAFECFGKDGDEWLAIEVRLWFEPDMLVERETLFPI